MAINTSKLHCMFLIPPRKKDFRPVGAIGTERSSWHLVWGRDLERGYRMKEGIQGEGKS